MKFHLFENNSETYLRKSREYLEEANLARVEHQAAAEHHAALAKMYTERIARIQAEISHVVQPCITAAREQSADEGERSNKSDSVLVYPSRSLRP